MRCEVVYNWNKMAETEEVFEVEQILARRQVDTDQTEYLVRWRGFDSDQDSWEPLDSLDHAARHIIAQFNEKSCNQHQHHVESPTGKLARRKASTRREAHQGPIASDSMTSQNVELKDDNSGPQNYSPGHQSRKSSVSVSPRPRSSPRKSPGSPRSPNNPDIILPKSSQDSPSSSSGELREGMGMPLILPLEPTRVSASGKGLLDLAANHRILPKRSCKKVGSLDVHDVSNCPSTSTTVQGHGEVKSMQSSLDIITGFEDMPTPLTPSPSVKSPRMSPRGISQMSEEDVELNGCVQNYPTALAMQARKSLSSAFRDELEEESSNNMAWATRQGRAGRRVQSLPGLHNVVRDRGHKRISDTTGSVVGSVPSIQVGETLSQVCTVSVPAPGRGLSSPRKRKMSNSPKSPVATEKLAPDFSNDPWHKQDSPVTRGQRKSGLTSLAQGDGGPDTETGVARFTVKRREVGRGRLDKSGYNVMMPLSPETKVLHLDIPTQVCAPQEEGSVNSAAEKFSPGHKKINQEDWFDSIGASLKSRESPPKSLRMNSGVYPIKGHINYSLQYGDHDPSAKHISLSPKHLGSQPSITTKPAALEAINGDETVDMKASSPTLVSKRDTNVRPDSGRKIIKVSPQKINGSQNPADKAALSPKKMLEKDLKSAKNSSEVKQDKSPGNNKVPAVRYKTRNKSSATSDGSSPLQNVDSSPGKRVTRTQSLQQSLGNTSSQLSPGKVKKGRWLTKTKREAAGASKDKGKGKTRDEPKPKSIPITVSMAKKLKSAAQKRVQVKTNGKSKDKEKPTWRPRSPRSPRKSPRIILKDVIQLSKREYEKITGESKNLVLSVQECDSLMKQSGMPNWQIGKKMAKTASSFKVAKKMAEQVPVSANVWMSAQRQHSANLGWQANASQSSTNKKLRQYKSSQNQQGNITKKGKNTRKTVSSKDQRRKPSKRPISPDTSDDDVLYSLNPDFEKSHMPKPPKRSRTDREVESVTRLEREGSSSASSPTTSPRKLLLKDSIKPKKVINPVPRTAALPPSPAKAASATQSLDCGPRQMSPRSSIQGNLSYHQGESTSRGDTYVSDLPTIPVIPFIPSSPSTASYKNLLKNLPNNLQANRSGKRAGKGSESGDDDELVERRVSVRHSESAFRYKEIIVKKCPGYTQMWLFTTTKMKNALNPKVFQELTQALHNAKFDDSRLVLLSGSGSVFCSGIDLSYLLTGDRRQNSCVMADAIRDFINVMITFPKPIVAAVNGPAIGLGVALLPLCDIIYASDKASFYCPFSRLSQTPEGCSSLTFPQVMGLAMANEMLLGGRKITAIEAYQIGLVSQVFWPTSMMQEVIPRIQNIASNSARSLEASKFLMRSHQRGKMELTNESECRMLAERWASSECQKAIRAYLDEEQDFLL